LCPKDNQLCPKDKPDGIVPINNQTKTVKSHRIEYSESRNLFPYRFVNDVGQSLEASKTCRRLNPEMRICAAQEGFRLAGTSLILAFKPGQGVLVLDHL
jgi:hypothetical protein